MMPAMRRFSRTLLTTIALFALLATTALAQNSGEGTYGETDDKVVTYAGFILIAFFPILIVVLNLIMGKLEKRKDSAREAAKAAGGDKRWDGGW
jgi:hypothetical protein